MKNILLFVFSVFILSGSCDIDRWGWIRIQNNSKLTIIVCGDYILPDTILPSKELKTIEILPGEVREIRGYLFDDDRFMRLKSEKLSLFVLDEQVFQTMPWDTVRKYNMVLKRYEINRQDYLDLVQYDKGWALPYP